MKNHLCKQSLCLCVFFVMFLFYRIFIYILLCFSLTQQPCRSFVLFSSAISVNVLEHKIQVRKGRKAFVSKHNTTFTLNPSIIIQQSQSVREAERQIQHTLITQGTEFQSKFDRFLFSSNKPKCNFTSTVCLRNLTETKYILPVTSSQRYQLSWERGWKRRGPLPLRQFKENVCRWNSNNVIIIMMIHV